MRVAQKFAGYSLEEADNLRKACGKKIRALIAAEREKFVAGCVAQGYGEELGTQLFDIIEPFADYAFNKSHSYGYGLVAYQTAWLKAHYPVEYMAALLTSVKDNKDKTAVYLAECRSMGIDVLVPDVNRSVAEFAPDRSGEPGPGPAGHRLRAGGGAQRRREPGRADRGRARRQRALRRHLRLLPAGRPGRPQQAHHGVAGQGRRLRLARPPPPGPVPGPRGDRRPHARAAPRAATSGSPRSSPPSRRSRPTRAGEAAKVAIPDTEFDKAQRLAFEKEMLGLYVSDHPLMGFEAALARHTDCTLSDMREEDAGGGGPLARADGRRGGDRPAPVLHEEGRPDGPLRPRGPRRRPWRSSSSPRRWPSTARCIENDAIVVVQGPARHPGGGAQDRLHGGLPPAARAGAGGPPHHAAARRADRRQGRRAQGGPERPPRALAGAPPRRRKVLRLPPEFNVDCRNGLVGELKRLLGQSAVLS